MDNKIINFFDNYINKYSIIFDRKSYIIMLEAKINDDEFMNDINLTIDEKIRFVNDIVDTHNINAYNCLKMLENKKSELDNSKKLENIGKDIKRLRERILNYNGEDLEILKNEFSEFKSSYEFLLGKGKSINNQNNIDNEIKECEFGLNNLINKTLTNKNYYDLTKRKFNTNKIWLSKYGTYTNNLFFDRKSEIIDDSLEFKEMYSCEYLKKCDKLLNSDKIFTPLIDEGKMYISTKANNIIRVDLETKDEEEILLNDYLVTPSILMKLKDTYLINVTNKSIVILKEDEVAFESSIERYIKDSRDYEIKYLNSFNNLFYFLINLYDKNISYIVRGYYNYSSDKFQLYKEYKDDLIISNLIFYFDNKTNRSSIIYFTNNEIKKINSSSDTIINKKNTNYVPWAYNFLKNSMEVRCDTNIVLHDDNIYFLSKGNNGRIYFCKYDCNFNDEDITKIELDTSAAIYADRYNNYLACNLTNFVLYDDDNIPCAQFVTKKGLKTTTVKYKNGPQLYDDSNIEEGIHSNCLLKYRNIKIINIKNNLENSRLNQLNIVSVYDDKIIAVNNIKDDKYIIYMSK